MDECDTYFKVCVSTFSSDDGQCLFGSSRTPVLGGNSFEKTGIDQHFIMKIPFKKSWAVSFTTLILHYYPVSYRTENGTLAIILSLFVPVFRVFWLFIFYFLTDISIRLSKEYFHSNVKDDF